MSSRGQGSESSGRTRLVRPVAFGILAGAVVCALVLLLMAALMTARSIPQFAVDPMAGMALIAGGLVAGFSCARALRENGLTYGALCGALFTVIVLLAGLAIRDNGFGIPALLKIVFIMLSSMLGGVLGVNARRRGSRGRKKKSAGR